MFNVGVEEVLEITVNNCYIKVLTETVRKNRNDGLTYEWEKVLIEIDPVYDFIIC